MCVLEERIVQITTIRKRHLLPQAIPLFLTHAGKSRFVLLVQSAVCPSQYHDHEAQQCQCDNDRDLAPDVTRCLASLESLRAEYVSDRKADERKGIGGDLFRVASEVGRIVGEKKHECGLVVHSQRIDNTRKETERLNLRQKYQSETKLPGELLCCAAYPLGQSRS